MGADRSLALNLLTQKTPILVVKQRLLNACVRQETGTSTRTAALVTAAPDEAAGACPQEHIPAVPNPGADSNHHQNRHPTTPSLPGESYSRFVE